MFDLVTENSFDLNKTNEYILSIQISLDGFSFSLISEKQNKLLALQNTPLKISNDKLISRRFKEWVEKENILSANFFLVRIIYQTPNFTTIPLEFSSPEKNASIANTLFETEIEAEIISNIIEDKNIEVLFSIPLNLKKIAAQYFNNFRFLHPITKILKFLPPVTAKNGLVLQIRSNYFTIVIYSPEKIQLANSFSFSHKNDILFYVLSCAKNIEINTKNTNLYFENSVGAKDEISGLFEKYFISVSNLHQLTNPNINSELFDASKLIYTLVP